MDPVKIDVHHHILPQEFVSKLAELGITKGLGVPLPDWNPEKSLAFMGKNGIRAAVVSIAVPGIVDDAVLRELSRWCNEYTAALKKDYPGVFNGLAALPLPDVAGALAEVEYALDRLNLDGVGLFTHYNGVYLGNKKFDDLFRELNKRKTVVFIHPIDPPEHYNPGLSMPHALIEASFETTRAVANLLYTGTLDTYPDIRYLLAHGGGTIPYLAWRIALVRYIQENKRPAAMRAFYDFYVRKGPETGLKLLKNMYYDTALTSSPYALRALQEFVGPSKIVFGTDYPFAAHLAPFAIKDLYRYGFCEEELSSIEYENSLNLFPQLRM